MTKTSSKKISRRDAIKLLGAAVGASVLANLPSKWSTPELASGVLPAHAQTSGLFSIITCGPSVLCPDAFGGEVVSVGILPAVAGISMTYNITTNGNTLLSPASGSELTNGVGTASTTVFAALNNPTPSTLVIQWSFTNPADGSGTCDVVFSWDNSCFN